MSVLITVRELNTGFKLVLKVMTLNDILQYLLLFCVKVATFVANYVKLTEATPILSMTKMWLTYSSHWHYMIYGDIRGNYQDKCNV